MTEATLIVVLCETRAHAKTFAGFKQNLLDVFDADLALCVAENEREDKGNPFYKHARYVWTCPEHEDWGCGFEQLMPDLHPRWRECAVIGTQWMGGIKSEPNHPGSGGIVLFFRVFLSRMLQQHGLLDQYDRIIITRSDYMFEVPHPPVELLDNQFIWIPDGEHYGGYTDRHIICPSRHVLEVLSAADLFKENPDEVTHRMKSRDWNVERVLKDHFERVGLSKWIRIMPYVMFAIREEGGHTSWSKGRYDKPMGFYVKYPEELRKSKLAATLLAAGDWNDATFNNLLRREKIRRTARKALRPFRRVGRRLYKRLLPTG